MWSHGPTGAAADGKMWSHFVFLVYGQLTLLGSKAWHGELIVLTDYGKPLEAEGGRETKGRRATAGAPRRPHGQSFCWASPAVGNRHVRQLHPQGRRAGRANCGQNIREPSACGYRRCRASPSLPCSPDDRITSHPVELVGSDHNPSCSRASGSGWRDHPFSRRLSARGLIRGRRPPDPAKPSRSASLEWG